MKPIQQQVRLKTVHSLSNNNHVNGIPYRLAHIWFPALILKGGSEANTSSNQNEETRNQSHASSVFTQVLHQCINSANEPSLFATCFGLFCMLFCTPSWILISSRQPFDRCLGLGSGRLLLSFNLLRILFRK